MNDSVVSLPVLVFDGDCGFCTTAASWGSRRLDLPHVEPWQRLDLASYGLTAEQCRAAVQWVSADRTILSGELAVAAALIAGGGVWASVGRSLSRPGVRQLARVIYRLVARFRYRLPGGTPACRL